MPKIKAKATFRNKRELPGGVIHPGETAEVRGSYAKAVVTKGLAEIVEDEPEDAPLEAYDPLEGVDFASEAALSAAMDAELDVRAGHFEDVDASGKTGYTKADIEAIAEEVGAE